MIFPSAPILLSGLCGLSLILLTLWKLFWMCHKPFNKTHPRYGRYVDEHGRIEFTFRLPSKGPLLQVCFMSHGPPAQFYYRYQAGPTPYAGALFWCPGDPTEPFVISHWSDAQAFSSRLTL